MEQSREQVIQNELGLRVANLELEKAHLKADLIASEQKNKELQAQIDELLEEEK